MNKSSFKALKIFEFNGAIAEGHSVKIFNMLIIVYIIKNAQSLQRILLQHNI
ncbi:hypothetical protein N8502_03230 [Gammaproteobacteria bacterium]|nr:hypothetical protein [Gammaproteobacteria bacterium]